MSDERSATEQRNELMEAAADLTMVLKQITGPVNKLINALIEAGDELKLDAADEKEEARHTITRKVHIKKLAEAASDAPTRQEMSAEGEVVERKQRKCSICHQPGHRSTTCTNGRKKTF